MLITKSLSQTLGFASQVMFFTDSRDPWDEFITMVSLHDFLGICFPEDPGSPEKSNDEQRVSFITS